MKRDFASLRMLIGMALIGAFSIPSHADFSLDKLKSLAEQAKAYQERLKQGSPSNTSAQTDPSAQASSNPMLTSETPGNNTQTGPNILGIQLGMTPSEVRRILAGRPGVRVNEARSALMYQPIAGHQKRIPNSDYVELISASGGLENITVVFTPVAGRERAISIERKQDFPAGQKPSIEATVGALIDKYGPYSYKLSPGGPFINYFWRFNSQAKLRDIKPDVPEGRGYSDICRNPARAALTAQQNLNSAQDIKMRQDILAKFEKCGHTQIFAELDGGGARADAPVVNSLKVILSAWVEAVATRRTVDSLIENYGKDQAGKEIQKADKRKLDL